MGLGGVSNLQGLQNLSGLAGLSGMGAGMMGSNRWNNTDGMLGNQVTLNNLINQNRSAENSKEKEAASTTNPSSGPNKDSGMPGMMGLSGMGMGGMPNLPNLPMGGMGMGGLGSNYDLIKSMILEEMKQQESERDKEKQEGPK